MSVELTREHGQPGRKTTSTILTVAETGAFRGRVPGSCRKHTRHELLADPPGVTVGGTAFAPRSGRVWSYCPECVETRARHYHDLDPVEDRDVILRRVITSNWYDGPQFATCYERVGLELGSLAFCPVDGMELVAVEGTDATCPDCGPITVTAKHRGE